MTAYWFFFSIVVLQMSYSLVSGLFISNAKRSFLPVKSIQNAAAINSQQYCRGNFKLSLIAPNLATVG